MSTTPLFAQAGSVNTAAPGSPQPSTTTSAPDGELRPYEGAVEQRSGELLLIEAYAAIWLVAFGLILLSLRRQRRLEERLDRLQEDLERAAKQQEQD